MKVVITKKYDTFKKFWNAVSPFGIIGKKLPYFIYRGESSDRDGDSGKRQLLPASLRNKKGKLWIWKKVDETDEYETTQIMREMVLLGEFYRIANENGLRVPNNEILKYSKDRTKDLILPFTWLSKESEETATLAQHYGVPTRLLDWTKDIFAAFYFASSGAIEKINNKSSTQNENMVIWALNYGYLSKQIAQSDWEKMQMKLLCSPLPLKFIIPQYSDNPNVRAQNGILSYWETYVEKDNNVDRQYKKDDDINDYMYRVRNASTKIDYTPLDEKLQKLADDYSSSPKKLRKLARSNNLSDRKKFEEFEIKSLVEYDEILLYRFELPVTEAINMYEFVARLNYSYGRLFPGYTGITKTIEEHEIFNIVKENLNAGGNL